MDLTRPLETDASLVLHKWEDEAAKHAFWHSSAHLMAEAIENLFPGTKIRDRSGYRERISITTLIPGKMKEVITEADLVSMRIKLKELAARNLVFTRKNVSKKEAMEFFTEKGDEYKLN